MGYAWVFLGVLVVGIGAGSFVKPAPILVSIRNHPPSLTHWMGTDSLGRDVANRLVSGARITVMTGVLAASIAMVIGSLWGLLAGMAGGIWDSVSMRILDMLMAVPTIFVVIIIQSVISPTWISVVWVIGLTSWMGVARLVRQTVMAIRVQPFILAARARGFGRFRIAVCHVVPHLIPVWAVAIPMGMGSAILTESALSFLGLGIQPPQASWGTMMESGLMTMTECPWTLVFPGIAIALTVLTCNVMSDAIGRSIR